MHDGQDFEVQTPDAAAIEKVVLVRPMAVTHQTDTEQKVLELPYVATGFSTFGTIATDGSVTDRFGVGDDFDALAFVNGNLGYGPNLFYYLRHDAAGFSTFGTIDTNGAVTDRFGVGTGFDALTYAAPDLGYGPNLFYYLRHDTTGACTFGTIGTNGTVTDRFAVGTGFDALTFASANLGYGPKRFYYLRHDPAGLLDVRDGRHQRRGHRPLRRRRRLRRPDVRQRERGVRAATCFYYLRHDTAGSSSFGTIDTNGAVTDRFGVGANFDALTFANGNLGYGPKHFYYLRRDITGLTVTAPDGAAPHSRAGRLLHALRAQQAGRALGRRMAAADVTRIV